MVCLQTDHCKANTEMDIQVIADNESPEKMGTRRRTKTSVIRPPAAPAQ